MGEGGAGSKTLWICRCAWTTLPRRPQLHRANISKHCLMETEKRAAAGAGGRVRQRDHARVRRRSVDGPAPHVKCAARRCAQWRAPLGSSRRQAPSDAGVRREGHRTFIVPSRAQASRRCETQATQKAASRQAPLAFRSLDPFRALRETGSQATG